MQGIDFDSIAWIDDINADFSRQPRYTNTIKSFIVQNESSKSWDRFPIDLTHVNEINNVTYIIDRCMCSSDLEEHISDVGVLHIPTNFSDHYPIYCQLKINGVKSRSVTNPVDPKPSWKQASGEQKHNYTTSSQEYLR